MLGLPVLDVGIGLIFIYLIFGLVCSAVREMLASVTNARMRTLSQGITNLLGPKADEFYEHGLIRSLYENGRRPSYIPTGTFALAALEVLAPTAENATRDFAAVRSSIHSIQNAAVRQSLLALADASNDDLDALRRNVEAWFEDAMQRVGAWYRRKTQWVLFVIAVVVAAVANVDTLTIANTLSQDSTMRSALVAEASAYVKANPNGPASLQDSINAARANGEIGIALGWDARRLAHIGWSNIAGMLISAFAFSLGAPFWFDMLNKIVTVRSSGNAPREKK